MNKTVLYIGEKNISSWSMRGWLAVRHKRLEFEERTILLREDRDRSQRRKVSPTGKVPVLHHDGLVIPDSLAIIEYLDEVCPAPGSAAMWPPGRAERAHARWLSAAMHSGFMAVRTGMAFNLAFLAEDLRTSDGAIAEAREMMSFWEDALSRSNGPFLFGAWGAVDIMYAPAVVRLQAFKIPCQDLPRARAYMQAVLSQPDVADWLQAARTLKPVATYG
jgi:glutathione S-transferase